MTTETEWKTEVRTRIEQEMDFNRKMIIEGGELLPRWVARNEAGETFVLMTPWPNENVKLAVVAMMKEFYRMHGVTEYLMSSEVWVSERLDGDGKGALEPRLDPDRKERVMTLAVRAGEPAICAYADIVRDADGKPLVGSLRYFDDDATGVTQGGRMLELLPGASTLTDAQKATLNDLWKRLGGTVQ